MEIWIGNHILTQILNIYWYQILLKVYFWSVQMLIKFFTIFSMFMLGRFFPKYRKKVLFLSNNKEKWDESFSHARATRKKQSQRAPQPLPTCFTRTGGASAVVLRRYPICAHWSPLCFAVTRYHAINRFEVRIVEWMAVWGPLRWHLHIGNPLSIIRA